MTNEMKRPKGRTLLVLVLIPLLIAVLLVSCKQDLTGPGSDSFKYNAAYINAHMPDQFSLSLSLIEGSADPETSTVQIIYGTDFFYLKSVDDNGTDEMLLKKNASGTWYFWDYEATPQAWNTDFSTGFSSNDAEAVVADLKASSLVFLGYHIPFLASGVFTAAGNETISGVSCEKYAMTYAGVTVSLWVDPDTGFGMKMQVSNASDHENDITLVVNDYSESDVECPVDTPIA